MSAPVSRPVHPCVINLTNGCRGAEFSTWAFITAGTGTRSSSVPNLVTASASNLNIYSVNAQTAKLRLEYSFGNLAGTIIFLATLSSGAVYDTDSLLVVFAGQPRLTVLRVSESVLRAYSLLDLSVALVEGSHGSTSVFQQDCVTTCLNSTPGNATVATILGGGVAVAVFKITYIKSCSGWIADDPYILPLRRLSEALPHRRKDGIICHLNSGHWSSMATGFGDIISVCFLSGYLEPVLVLLHTDPGGLTWCGRLGRITGGAVPVYVSAMSVSVSHQRTALLWYREVPADSFKVTSFGEKPRCLVTAANSLTLIEIGGKIQQSIAVNGFARSTCPISMISFLDANPIVKLSICLHGSKIAWISETTAFVVLRLGQLYVLQQTSSRWLLLGLGKMLGTLGEIACVSSRLLDSSSPKGLCRKISPHMSHQTGIFFAGSRLGDSTLLGFALEPSCFPSDLTYLLGDKVVGRIPRQVHSIQSATDVDTQQPNTSISDDVSWTLSREEQALYASFLPFACAPDVVPRSDEDDDKNVDFRDSQQLRKRQRTTNFSVIQTLQTLDSIGHLGPLGPSCEGPSASATANTTADGVPVTADTGYGAFAHVFPCGYGSSGGVALVTVLGRDDRTIIAEEDCADAEYLISLPLAGIVFLCLSRKVGSGVRVMRFTSISNKSVLQEINLDDWCRLIGPGIAPLPDSKNIFGTTILGSAEFADGSFALLVYYEDHDPTYLMIVLKESSGLLQVRSWSSLAPVKSLIVRITPFIIGSNATGQVVTFACMWASGIVSVTRMTSNGDFSSCLLAQELTERQTRAVDLENLDELELKKFYGDTAVTAIDVFEAPIASFQAREIGCNPSNLGFWNCVASKQSLSDSGERLSREVNLISDIPDRFGNFQVELDKEDEELYTSKENLTERNRSYVQNLDSVSGPEFKSSVNGTFMALTTRSGDIEIHAITENGLKKCWYSKGAGIGLSVLKACLREDEIRLPHSHMDSVEEIRFFSLGSDNNISFVIETNHMDVFLYEMKRNLFNKLSPEFRRIPMKSVSRPSQEQARHDSKLTRDVGSTEIPPNAIETGLPFKHNNMFRFCGVSGQAGLFVACSRPFWVLSDRGHPTIAPHRSRHAAPAGFKKRPVRGFCIGQLAGGYFLTLHERVGRGGSQRLTLYKGMSTKLASSGLLPGSGYCIERVPMGVTVRRIQFIDDSKTSNDDHPLYAMLISRELEVDQRAFNFDGLSNEERKRLQDERESAKIQRQVEADLGGFDMESEWVEEIEREECFRVDADLGGAPPMLESVYSLWIVDAANKWMVVDSFELGKYEHGLDLQVMELTEFREELGITNTKISLDEELSKKLFVIVGTGMVSRDGEDVSSKGRVLLFKIKRHTQNNRLPMTQVAELELSYEKEIYHGPVSTLGCLSSEGKNRLVIGAGSDINIEQWSNHSKLTQVGFFRATMQIASVTLFKHFLLLSDAYDSLYFLVWRESDKSLTLLAKDYDPIPVHAIGVMSSGAAVTFVCHDDRQNLQFFQYAPGEAAARGGNKLVCRADYHCGSQTTAFSSYLCKSSLLAHSATPRSTFSALGHKDFFPIRQDDNNNIRLGIFFGTTDGGLASVVPLGEPVYWRLLALQSIMRNALESNCSLSRRAWRLYVRTSRRGGCRSNDRKKGVIDGDVVLQYPDLPRPEQEDIASAIGSTVNLILDNLLELHCSSIIL